MVILSFKFIKYIIINNLEIFKIYLFIIFNKMGKVLITLWDEICKQYIWD